MNYSQRSYWFWFQSEISLHFSALLFLWEAKLDKLVYIPQELNEMNVDESIIQQIEQAENDTCRKRYFLHPSLCFPPGCGQNAWFEAIKSRKSLKSIFWTYRTGMHMLISRCSRDIIRHQTIQPRLVPHYTVSLTHSNPAQAAVLR